MSDVSIAHPACLTRATRSAGARAALVRALLRREWTSPWHLPAAALVATGAALLGRRLADTVTLAPPTAVGAGGGGALLAAFGRYCGAAVAIAGVLLVVERLAADRDARWPALPFAAGASRAAYALTVTLAAAAVAAAGAPLALHAFAAGAAPGDAALARAMAAATPGVCALAVSCACYGALCATLTRSRGAALAVAAAGLALPAVTLGVYRAHTGASLPRPLMRVATLHLPPFTIASELRALLWHLAWSVLAAIALGWLAGTRIGREP